MANNAIVAPPAATTRVIRRIPTSKSTTNIISSLPDGRLRRTEAMVAMAHVIDVAGLMELERRVPGAGRHLRVGRPTAVSDDGDVDGLPQRRQLAQQPLEVGAFDPQHLDRFQGRHRG